MYILNTREYFGPFIPGGSLRYLTEDPKQALKEARALFQEETNSVNCVTIYRLTQHRLYEVQDSKGTEDNPPLTVVFAIFKEKKEPKGFKEMFFHDFCEVCGVNQKRSLLEIQVSYPMEAPATA